VAGQLQQRGRRPDLARRPGRDKATAAVDRFAFADFWGKLAAIFKANPLVEYGLVNEPHDMSTMSWWTTAQKCVDAIRLAGATTTIYVPGNGYTAASRWTDESVDTDTPQRSNAYGWLHVNNGAPLFDPQHDYVAEVHVYLDEDGSGTGQDVVSSTIARTNLTHAVDEARAQGYRVFVGEIGAVATADHASAAWRDFVAYLDAPDASRGGPGAGPESGPTRPPPTSPSARPTPTRSRATRPTWPSSRTTSRRDVRPPPYDPDRDPDG
jgi:hypothetical protein